MADNQLGWLESLLAEQMDPNVGGGAGLLPEGSMEILKAITGAHNSVAKLNDAVASGGSPDAAPPGQAISQATAGAPNRWDAFAKALNTPQGAGGFANLLGTIGAAVSAPNSWQSRLGTASAGLGRNTVAGAASKDLLDRLIPPNVAAPNAAAGGTVPAPVSTVPNDIGNPNFRGPLLQMGNPFGDLLKR